MLHHQKQSNREQEATVPLLAKLFLASGQQQNVEQHSSETRPGTRAFEALVHWLWAGLTASERGHLQCLPCRVLPVLPVGQGVVSFKLTVVHLVRYTQACLAALTS